MSPRPLSHVTRTLSYVTWNSINLSIVKDLQYSFTDAWWLLRTHMLVVKSFNLYILALAKRVTFRLKMVDRIASPSSSVGIRSCWKSHKRVRRHHKYHLHQQTWRLLRSRWKLAQHSVKQMKKHLSCQNNFFWYNAAIFIKSVWSCPLHKTNMFLLHDCESDCRFSISWLHKNTNFNCPMAPTSRQEGVIYLVCLL